MERDGTTRVRSARPRTRAKPCGIVLTGGESRRMGRDKALLELPDGRPMVLAVCERLALACDPVIAVDPRPERLAYLGCAAVADVRPGRGPLSGLVAGLLASPRPKVFVVACDMPFVEPALVALLARRLGSRDAVVPFVGGRVEPLAALYARKLLPRALELLADGAHGLHELLESSRHVRIEEDELRSVDPTLESFRNLNSPANMTCAFPKAPRSGHAGS